MNRREVLREWDRLPKFMRIPEVRPYYEILDKHRTSLVLKRSFDFFMAVFLLAVLAVPMAFVALAVRFDSPGPAMYRQERVTAYGRKFRIHKFRTMTVEAESSGTQVTVKEDSRITRVGKYLRKYRLDEIPQLIDILEGSMSFVGTRPEVPRYVRQYTEEMRATLLLPAGITSQASIRYRDEAELLDGAEDADRVYVEEILPQKMRWNLHSLKRFSLWNEIIVMGQTIMAVLKGNG